MWRIVIFQLLSRVFVTPWIAACKTSLSITISWCLLKLMSIITSVISFNCLILCHPRLPSIFPSIRVFSNELALCIRWPSIGTSASVSILPINIQGWFPLGLIGLISLQSKGFSKVFSKINSLVLSLLDGPTLISIHDYSKNYSFDYTDLCWQSNVSAF